MNRRAVVNVERLESRDTPSTIALSGAVGTSPAAIRSYEDPNLLVPSIRTSAVEVGMSPNAIRTIEDPNV